MQAIDAPTLDEIRGAVARIRDSALRTPLVRLNTDHAPAEIWLKLENLQPIGSFKLRGAGNAIGLLPRDALARGVYTASAGNMAQGLAWNARRLGIPCSVVVPDDAPRTKLDATIRLGARIVALPRSEWWEVIVRHGHPDVPGTFIHPVSDRNVIAGNGTIGLEIAEDLPGVDTVIVPYGGGGLSCGIATALRGVAPNCKVYASEVEGAAPVSASLAAGRPTAVAFTPSFVDGIGSKGVLDEMWPLVQRLLAGSYVVSPADTAAAIKRLVERNRVVAEGAGATSVAAAERLAGQGGKIVCVVSGGNIDAAKLATILAGEVP